MHSTLLSTWISYWIAVHFKQYEPSALPIKENDNLLNSILLSIYSNTCFMFHYYCYMPTGGCIAGLLTFCYAIQHKASDYYYSHTHTSSYISINVNEHNDAKNYEWKLLYMVVWLNVCKAARVNRVCAVYIRMCCIAFDVRCCDVTWVNGCHCTYLQIIYYRQ